MKRPLGSNVQENSLHDEFHETIGGITPKKKLLTKCFGNIDSLNGISPAPSSLKLKNLFSANGWLLASVNDASLPDAIYLILKDSNGKSHYLRGMPENRQDVGNYFKIRKFDMSGFRATADISKFPNGKYSLGLSMLTSEGILNCPEFQIPLEIEK